MPEKSKIIMKTGKTSIVLLSAWCLLPVVMSIYCFLCAISNRSYVPLGRTEYDFIAPWYTAQVSIYLFAFRILGCVTLIWALYVLLKYRSRIFGREAEKKHIWMLLFLALLCWMTLSALLAKDVRRAFEGAEYLYCGMSSYFIFSGVFICAANIRIGCHKRAILQLYCGVMTFLSLLVIIQALFDTVLDLTLMPDYAAVFNQHNHFGYVLCMGILTAAGLYLLDEKANALCKVQYLLSFTFQLYALLINNTFGSYLATLLSLPILYVFYLKSGRKLRHIQILPFVIFIVVSAACYTGLIPSSGMLAERTSGFVRDIQDVATGSEDAIHAGTGRGMLWKQTIDRVRQRPLFGFGPEGFYGDDAIISHDGHTQDSPHNEFLQMAGFSGIPALLLYLAGLVTLAIDRWKRLKQIEAITIIASGGVVVYLISSFFGNPVFNTTPYFFIFLGMIATNGEGDESVVSQKKSVLGKRETPKPIKAALMLMACVVCAGLLYTVSLKDENEKLYEFADLQAMNNAQLTVEAYYRNGGLGEHMDFWYEATSFKLIPITQPAPTPYGMGSRANADIKDAFNWQNKTNLDYDEKADYTGKIIKVHIEETGEDLKINMEWVSAQQEK